MYATAFADGLRNTLMLQKISPYWLWFLLAFPAIGMAFQLATSTDPRLAHELVHPTGEFAARFTIIAMLASPLVLLLRGWRGPQWLKKNRRYFGVAAFGYAFFHTILYVIDLNSVERILCDLPKFYIWTGWIALAIFVPLAITSMDYFVRLLGPSWKRLQRWTYAAAVLTLLHWAALHDWDGLTPALIHFGPLGLLEGYRVWYWYIRPRSQNTKA